MPEMDGLQMSKIMKQILSDSGYRIDTALIYAITAMNDKHVDNEY